MHWGISTIHRSYSPVHSMAHLGVTEDWTPLHLAAAHSSSTRGLETMSTLLELRFSERWGANDGMWPPKQELTRNQWGWGLTWSDLRNSYGDPGSRNSPPNQWGTGHRGCWAWFWRILPTKIGGYNGQAHWQPSSGLQHGGFSHQKFIGVDLDIFRNMGIYYITNMLPGYYNSIWLVVWNLWIIFPYIGNHHHPNWRSYFSEGYHQPGIF